MKLHIKVAVVFLAFLSIGSEARADGTLACQLPSGFDASEYNECGTAGDDTGGPSTPAQALAVKNCQQAATAGIANCKRLGGTGLQISSCETKVQNAAQQCSKRALANNGPGPDFGQAGDNTITGNTSDPFDSAASGASAAVAAQASAANAEAASRKAAATEPSQ
jgi:hypothetical protein